MIGLKEAQKALELAHAKAHDLGVEVSIALVDTAGTLIASLKMDNAITISPKFAYVKAFTSASIGMPSAALAPYDVPGKPYYGVHTILAGELTTIAGGQPIMVDGKLVGGVGVGGSTDVAQDDECAKAALAAFV
ncbi:MAG TPA: heme-binding protein [Patescibacteria group bacterium]|nr:heme-binding protein [Patescibacteria group bacterium]